MKWRLWRKQESIIGKIEAYLNEVDACRDLFVAAIGTLIADPSQTSSQQVAEVRHAEARADDLRRDIELDLYQKALIPESRGDVLGLIEATDTIPNAFEHIVMDMFIQQQEIPKSYRDGFRELVHVNIEAYNAMRDAVRDFFYNRHDPIEKLSHIDERESRSDKLQRKLVKSVFSDDMPTANKILLRDIINQVGSISDRAEDCSDRIMLAVIKRKA